MKKTSLISLLGVSVLIVYLVFPVSAVGIFRNSTGNWYLDYNNTGIVDNSFHFGAEGDNPVIGDWDGNGIDGSAVFRPSTGYWYFDYNLDGKVDKSFRYGGVADQIIVGDWEGTGSDGIAIFRPSTGYWYFDYNLDGKVDKSFRYGGVGDQIIQGNWQGSNDGIAIFRPSTGYWYFDYNLDGKVDKSFRYGGSTDKIVKEDWEGTGRDGIAIFRPSTGYWYVDNNLDGAVDRSFRYGGSSDRIIIGKWNSAAIGFPVADFTADRQSGTAPLMVMFTDQSTGSAPLTYTWDFTNDGVIDSTLANPSFMYPSADTYTVRHTVTNRAGSAAAIKTGYVTVSPAPVAPTAQFSANVRSGNAPLTVRFTDSSTGSTPMTYSWNFGDGVTSNDQNPVHTYSAIGTYTVILTAINSLGTDVATRTGYIIVTEGQSGGSHAGIALTFDDDYIDQWYGIRDILKRNNAHATFFVSNFASLNRDQIDKLKSLQADGNEIAYHGYSHEPASEYLKSHTMNEYLENEIINGVNLMKNEGFNPVDFAYPYGFDDPNATVALQAYFRHIRDTHYGWDELIYYRYGSNQAFISGIEIDDQNSGTTLDDIYTGIAKAKQDNTILIVYGHIPVQTITGDWQTSYDRLEKIMNNVSENNMKFYTISELT